MINIIKSKKELKQIICLIAIIAMVITMAPITAMAEEVAKQERPIGYKLAYVEGDYEVTVNGESILPNTEYAFDGKSSYTFAFKPKDDEMYGLEVYSGREFTGDKECIRIGEGLSYDEKTNTYSYTITDTNRYYLISPAGYIYPFNGEFVLNCDSAMAYTFMLNDTEIMQYTMQDGLYIYKYDYKIENKLKIIPDRSEDKPAAIDIWEGNRITHTFRGDEIKEENGYFTIDYAFPKTNLAVRFNIYTEEQKLQDIDVMYSTHIQSYGWDAEDNNPRIWKKNGNVSGTSGEAKRLEAIKIIVDATDDEVGVPLGVQYTTHCQTYGWLPWSANGEMNGTSGEAKRLEAIKIQLTGADKDRYDIYYRVHAQTYGWLGWAKNGEPAGTAGLAKRLEGIQIVVVKKGEDFDRNKDSIVSAREEAYISQTGEAVVVPNSEKPNVTYNTHVQSYGWQQQKHNGQMSGTSGEAKRLEAIQISLSNIDYYGAGSVIYTTHVQSYGWLNNLYDMSTWAKNGKVSGTSGEAKRLEAICIALDGQLSFEYDIYYRVHAQTYGWLGWAKNGEPAGTAGLSKRLEGIQIVVMPKGERPSDTYEGVTSNNTEAYIVK